MNPDIKIVTRLETFLARTFGKKTVAEDDKLIVTFHTWLGKLYITSIETKGHKNGA